MGRTFPLICMVPLLGALAPCYSQYCEYWGDRPYYYYHGRPYYYYSRHRTINDLKWEQEHRKLHEKNLQLREKELKLKKAELEASQRKLKAQQQKKTPRKKQAPPEAPPVPPPVQQELAATAEANGEIQELTRELPEPEMLFKLKEDTWLFTEERMATIYGKLTPDRKADKDEYTALLEKGGKAMRLPAGANIIINRVYQKDIATKDSPLVICFVECLSENVEGFIHWEEANPQEKDGKDTPAPEGIK